MFVDDPPQDDMSNSGLKIEMERLHRMTVAQISETEARLDSSGLKSEMERLHYMTMTKMYESEVRLENYMRNVACNGREVVYRRVEQEPPQAMFESHPAAQGTSDAVSPGPSDEVSGERSLDNFQVMAENSHHLREYAEADAAKAETNAENWNLRGYKEADGRPPDGTKAGTDGAEGDMELVRLRRLREQRQPHQSQRNEDRRVSESKEALATTDPVKAPESEKEEVEIPIAVEPGADEPLDVAGGFGHGYEQGPRAPRPEVRSQLHLKRWRVGLEELKVQRRADPSSPVIQELRLGDIVEQVAPAFHFQRGLIRIQVRQPSSPTYPLPIGWITQERGSHKMLEPVD